MKLLVIGDLHGRKPKIHFRDFDAIVFVGDICDDRELKKYYKQLFRLVKKAEKEKEEKGESKTEIPGIEEYIISKVGEKGFENMRNRSINKGREILKYLDSFQKPVFMVAGNWDESYGPSRIKDMDKSSYNYIKSFYDWWLGDKINSKLIKDLRNVKNCMYQVQEFECKGIKINFYGYGLSSASESIKERKKKMAKRGKLDISENEFGKLQKSYNKILNKLKENYKKRKDNSYPLVFITHNAPYKTKLDKVKDKGSYAHGKHLGSSVARWFIKNFQPFLCIGGHIHEGIGKDKIGKTLIVNPGFGQDAQVLIDLDLGFRNKKKKSPGKKSKVKNKPKIKKINFYKKN